MWHSLAGLDQYTRIQSQSGQTDLDGQSERPPFSIPTDSITSLQI